jgi:hypothetical protein
VNAETTWNWGIAPIVPAGCDNPGVPGPPADRAAIALVLLFTSLAVAFGVRAGYKELDIDELVYRETLVAMHHGAGYYHAMGRALTQKEGTPPSQVRSVRPPTLFLMLYRLPPRSWRWVVGLVYLATLLLAWRLARPFTAWGGPLAVVLAGMWLLGAAPLLFLHSELWAVPLVLAGALALRNGRWAAAALLLGAAVLFRETYAVPFLAGLLWTRQRRPFLVVLGLLAVLAGVHTWLAQAALSPHGREPAFGASGLSANYVLSAVSPADRPLAWVVGLAGGLLGLAGSAARWSEDRAARLVLCSGVVLAPATILVGREYWGLTFGVALACFVPAGVQSLRRSPRPS